MKPFNVNSDEHYPVYQDCSTLQYIVEQSFNKIAPFWPLKNLIAVNPLQGLEDLQFEDALKMGATYFQQSGIPKEMHAVNKESIKWLQAYFDEGQATITMPLRNQGLFSSWIKLAVYDKMLHENNQQKKQWLSSLPKNPVDVIAQCMRYLNVVQEQQQQFLILMLTTLPGWASYIKYRTSWAGPYSGHPYPVTQLEYMALRLTIACLIWPNAISLLDWHSRALLKSPTDTLTKIEKNESAYRAPLLHKLAIQPIQQLHIPKAQLVFCIDVRSEPFRRSLEATGDYQTFGFAGFFGISVRITDTVTEDSYPSCPVLLTPKHEVMDSACFYDGCEYDQHGYERHKIFKRLYQSVKYNFTTPFVLVEALGFFSGVWMLLRSLSPRLASRVKTRLLHSDKVNKPTSLSLKNINFTEQCVYAKSALSMIGLTSGFAPVVVLCGHGSTTQNNAFATALDCGACGGRHGASNARILAEILNRIEVRNELKKNDINIPQETVFIAAEHNTTTDEVILYNGLETSMIKNLQNDLSLARMKNNAIRLDKLKKNVNHTRAASDVMMRSQDWAQVRPEWGLARNCAFIIGPRDLTASVDLDGRCFLHSYDPRLDTDGSNLTTILTAPMVVAQWINTQYLFSTIDNVSYGAGSKITKNITGKMGVMQGNASDLMTGLPLQSVYSSDSDPYHEPQRLLTVVFSPRSRIDDIIHKQAVLQKLFGNGWVQLAVIEPDSRNIYLLMRDYSWQELSR